MVYKRYYSPFEEKRPVVNAEQTSPVRENKVKNECTTTQPFDFLNKIECDDLILIGIIIILLSEDKEKRDIPLILAVAFLFIIQYIDAD